MPPILYTRQKQILDFISQYIQQHGYSPTLKEIAAAMSLKSLATVHEHLSALAKKGLIKRRDGATRGIEIIEQNRPDVAEGLELAVLGFIAAGQPLEPHTDPNARLAVAPSLVSSRKRAFVLQVRGDSMINDGIWDGDFVVIEQVTAEEVNNGDVVVALLENGLATLKRYFQEATRIRLEPANEQMEPIFVKSVQIQGRVVGLIRRFQMN